MDFTFGIICRQDSAQRLRDISASIQKQNIPSYEILVIGNPDGLEPIKNMRVIPFDEHYKIGWITRKKNLITQNARFDNIVYLHDYITLEDDWYKGWLQFGPNYHAAMNIILNKDGTRYRDWVLWVDRPVINALARVGAGTHACLLPYEETELTKFQYFSGAYWVAKKHVMQEFPLNENLTWGEGEDVEWSERVRAKYKLSMNKNSTVRITRDSKYVTFYDIGSHYEQVKNILLGR